MRHSLLASLTVAVSIFSLYACGGSDGGGAADTSDSGTGDTDAGKVAVDAGPPVDNGAPSTTYPAFKVDPPQVTTQHGPVLAAPKIVPVYFNHDDTAFTGSITTFLDKLPGSTYWGPAETEYGVGKISVTDPVQLTDDAPTSIDDSAIQTWLAGEIATPPTGWPAPDANTIYALFYPSATTSITLGQGGGTSCQDWGGYHQDILVGGSTHVAYAVIPRCPDFDGFTGLNAVTAAASHELIEASTDPYPINAPAFGNLDDAHIIWQFLLGGSEVSDMCAQSLSSYYSPPDIGSIVTRSWSNASAKAGHDPCVPTDGTPYFNSMPVLGESVNVGGQFNSKGVKIPVGSSKTIEVDLFSDAATSGPWSVDVTDSATLQGQTPELEFSWDRTSGVNGEKLHLTITVDKASQYNAEGFIISSTLGDRTNTWVGLVAN